MIDQYVTALNQLIHPCAVISSRRNSAGQQMVRNLPEQETLTFEAEAISGEKLLCPTCNSVCKSKGKSRSRTIRHFDLDELLVFVNIRFPRVVCPSHGTLVCAQSFCDSKCQYSRNFEGAITRQFIASDCTLPDFATENRLAVSTLRRILERHTKRKCKKPF